MKYINIYALAAGYVICYYYTMKKHRHDIERYEYYRNKGWTWDEISERLNIPESSIRSYINYNFNEIITYTYEPRK